MDGIAIAGQGRRDHRLLVEIGGNAAARQGQRPIRRQHMQRPAIVLAMQGQGLDAEALGGPGDTDGDLAPVGDQDATEH